MTKVIKSIWFTEEQAAELRDYVKQTGEVEAVALKRAALRGLRENRLDQGSLAYLNGSSSGEAAAIAGLPRAQFLNLLMERGVAVLRDPSTVYEEVAFATQALDNQRPLDAVARLNDATPS